MAHVYYSENLFNIVSQTSGSATLSITGMISWLERDNCAPCHGRQKEAEQLQQCPSINILTHHTQTKFHCRLSISLDRVYAVCTLCGRCKVCVAVHVLHVIISRLKLARCTGTMNIDEKESPCGRRVKGIITTDHPGSSSSPS